MIETWAFALAVAFVVSEPPPPSYDRPPTEDGVVRRKIRLDEVVEHAREQSGQTLLSEAEIQRGVAEQAAAQPLLPGNPNLAVLLGGRTNPNGANWEGQFQVNQPIAIAGQRRFRRTAATRQREALEQQYARFQWEAEVETRTAFHLALLAQRRAESAVTTAQFLEQVVAITRALVETGEESPLRLRLAQAELAQAHAALKDAQYQYRAACNRLSLTSGWPLDEILEPEGELPLPRFGELQTSEGLLADHPLTRALQSRVRAAEALGQSARRDAWPHVSLGVYYATEQEPLAIRSHVGMGVLTMSLPAWRRNQGGIARAEAEVQIAQRELFVVHRTLTRELQRTADALVTASSRLKTYSDELLPRFSENLELVRRAFELGEIDVLEVFVARERFVDLQKQALDVYDDFIRAVRDYELAAGARMNAG